MADNVIIKIMTALLKHQVKKLVGEDALGVIGEELTAIGGDKLDDQVKAWLGEKTTADKIEKAADYALNNFGEKIQDDDLRQWIVMLPLGDLPDVFSAIEELPTSPDETKLEKALRDSISANWKNLSNEQIDNAVSAFMSSLRSALLPLEKQTLMIIGHSVLRSEEKINLLLSLVDKLQPQEASIYPETRFGKIEVNIEGNAKENTIIAGSHNRVNNNTVNQYISLDNLPILIEKSINNLTQKINDVNEFENTEDTEKKRLKDAIDNYIEKINLQVELAKKDYFVDNPYKPLQEYDISDIPFFFGREQTTKDLLQAIDSRSLIVLHAESGAGKSSLLKAAIRPQLLANNKLPIYVRPQKYQVEEAIKRSIFPNLEQSKMWMNTNLHNFLQETVNLLGGRRLVIILDQFEEIFTLQTNEMQERFNQELALCLNDDLLPVNWIISLRTEFLGQLSTLKPPMIETIYGGRLLQPLTKKEAIQAISEPAKKGGVQYEDGLVELILEDLEALEKNETKRVYLPGLQIVCYTLFNNSKNEGVIRYSSYQSLRRAKGILEDYFDKFMNQNIQSNQRKLAREILFKLVNSNGIRISRTQSEIKSSLASGKIDSAFLDDLIESLRKAHLIRVVDTSNFQQDEIAFELTHDYLIEKIQLDPISQDRKIVQELIEQKTVHFNRDGLLLSSEELKYVSPHTEWLNLTGKSLELFQKSKIAQLQNYFRMFIVFTSIIIFSSVLTYFVFNNTVDSPSITTTPPFVGVSGGGLNIIYLFWMYVILFGIIGAVRGWAKESLIIFSVVVALTVNLLLERYLPRVRDLNRDSTYLFWIRIIILTAFVYFGYQTANVLRFAPKASRENLQDSLFGSVLGGVNGYLIAGTVLYYNHVANYPYPHILSSATDQLIASTIERVMIVMPPRIVSEPGIYFVVIIILIFIVIVFK